MILDIGCLLFLAIGTYQGIAKGFLGSLLDFFKFFIALIVALRFSNLMSRLLVNWLNFDAYYTPIVAFVLIMILTMIVLYLIAKWVDYFMKTTQLGLLNKAFGIVLWIFILMFIFSGLLNISNRIGIISPTLKSESHLAGIMEPFAPKVIEQLKPTLPAIRNLTQGMKGAIQPPAESPSEPNSPSSTQ